MPASRFAERPIGNRRASAPVALETAAACLSAAGADVTERALPALFAGLSEAGMTILVREARQGLAHELRIARER